MSLRIGSSDYMDQYPNRVGIFNGEYDEEGNRGDRAVFRWFITHRGRHWGGGFPSHEDATDFVREHLNNQAVS